MKFKSILTVSLLCTALFGDYVIFKSKYSNYRVFRALADTCVHGIIGCISSVIFFSYDHGLTAQAYIGNIVFCTIVSSLIDIDHVLAARSLHWKDIMNVKHRGIFHSTTFWMVIASVISIYGYVKKKLNIYTIAFMLLTAALSHHIRDGNRRGLWFPPFGSTPPLDRFLYITLLGICPHILAYIYVHSKPNLFRYVVINEKIIV